MYDTVVERKRGKRREQNHLGLESENGGWGEEEEWLKPNRDAVYIPPHSCHPQRSRVKEADDYVHFG